MLNVQINRIHSGAVCRAIGERLSELLNPQSNELPPSLRALMEQLANLNLDVPSKIRPETSIDSE